ncbi:MAG: hypothetical protein Q9160_003718 [Pyrenula sp. 1 TL-2023]
MWLLDARDIDVTGKSHLKSFKEKDIPPYAILSHTWIEDDSEEVSFQDMKSGLIMEKLGYGKVLNCCLKARDNGLEYCWIDSCCINKDSSTELSEAINSMFLWYKQAKVCYAYLSDVHASCADTLAQFIASRWFRRGWTLQELIAPTQVEFFGYDWEYIGTKASMDVSISMATGIPCDCLLDGERVKTASVAARMSWAAKRETTRVEDLAYSLLGIFGVNMSLMYGERENAFVRLQEEIAKDIDDQSLFAWESSEPDDYCGILARSPRDFLNSSTINAMSGYLNVEPVTITNLGMKFYMPFIRREEIEGHFLGLIYCSDSKYDEDMIGLYLRSTQGTLDTGEQLERVPDSKLVRVSDFVLEAGQRDEMTVYIAKKGLSIESSSIRVTRQNSFGVYIDHSRIPGECSIEGFYPPCQQVEPALTLLYLNPLSYGSKHVVIGVKQSDQTLFYLDFGFSSRPNKTEASAYWYTTVDDGPDRLGRGHDQDLGSEAIKESRLTSECDLASRHHEIWSESDRSVKWQVEKRGSEIPSDRYKIKLRIHKVQSLGMVYHQVTLFYLEQLILPTIPSR